MKVPSFLLSLSKRFLFLFVVVSMLFLVSGAVRKAQALEKRSNFVDAQTVLEGNKVRYSNSEISSMASREKKFKDVDGNYYVRVLMKDLDNSEMQDIEERSGVSFAKQSYTNKQKFGNSRYALVKVEKGQTVESVMQSLNQDKDVLLFGPMYERRISQWYPNDPKFTDLTQWQLQDMGTDVTIDAPSAWSYVNTNIPVPGDYGGADDLVVAVLDTGYAYENYTDTYGWAFGTSPERSARLWTNSAESVGDANSDGCPGVCGVDDDLDGLIDEDTYGLQPGDSGYANDTVNDDDENGFNDDIHGANIYAWWFYPGVDDGHPNDDNGHGTFVTNILAGDTNNSNEGAGIAFNVEIMPIKVADMDGYVGDYISGLGYAVDSGASVVNMSFGGEGYDPFEYVALYLVAEIYDIVPVAASGNYPPATSLSTMQYPAGYPDVIGVGATNDDGSRSSYSVYGLHTDISAPVGDSSGGFDGYYQQSYTCFYTGTCLAGDPRVPVAGAFTTFSNQKGQGTSYAAPQVSAVAALVRSVYPTWPARKVRYVVNRSAYYPGSEPAHIGWGVVNAYQAVAAMGPDANDLSDDNYEMPGYFAEGYTGSGFEEWVLIMNPLRIDAPARIEFLTPDGTVWTSDFIVPARSRYSVKVDDYIPDDSVSTKVYSLNGVRLYSERAMYGPDRRWGHDTIGADEPSTTWYFAEGFTGADFEEWLLMMNPTGDPIDVDVTFMVPGGSGNVTNPYTIAANSRYSIKVDDVIDGSCSIFIDADYGIVAERAMYWGGMKGAHVTIGATGLEQDWYFAEGFTGADFEEWLLIMNPDTSPVDVDVHYLVPGGAGNQTLSYTIPAESRYTIKVNDVLIDSNSLHVEVTSGSGVVAERAMYWGNREGGHDTVGVTTLGQKWFFAEGFTGADFEEWLLLMNPNGSSVDVEVTFMVPGGSGNVTNPYTIPANSRFTIPVDSVIPGNSVSIMVQVISGGDIMAERAMYWSNRIDGHVTIGTLDETVY